MLTEIQFEQAVAAFVTFFVLIDAPGVAPIFASLTAPGGCGLCAQDGDQGDLRRSPDPVLLRLRRRVAACSHLASLLDAFRVAGGALLFLIALEMVFEKRQAAPEDPRGSGARG